jgi:hypothetical protein
MEHSRELVLRMQKYCIERHHKEINEDEAEEYLNSIGRLFLIVAKIEERKLKNQ